MSGWAVLTGRQTQVARLIAKGLTNKEIGERLGMSPHTVKSHTEKVFEEFGARNRTQLATLLAEADMPPLASSCRAEQIQALLVQLRGELDGQRQLVDRLLTLIAGIPQ